MLSLLALAPIQTWGIGESLIAIVVICAAVGVVYLVCTKVFHVTIPDWFIQILWICLAALVAVIAIRFIFSL